MESKYTIDYTDKTLRVELWGKLDATNSPSLSEELSKYKDREITNLVFDAKNLEYISSAGIRVIVFAKQKIGSKSDLYLVSASEMVLDVINMTGLANFMIIKDSF